MPGAKDTGNQMTPFSPEGLISPSPIFFSGSASPVLHLGRTFNQVRHQQAGRYCLRGADPISHTALAQNQTKTQQRSLWSKKPHTETQARKTWNSPYSCCKAVRFHRSRTGKTGRDRWGRERDMRNATAPPPYLPSCSHSSLSIIERPPHRAKRKRLLTCLLSVLNPLFNM